jgi:hypothetical protein
MPGNYPLSGALVLRGLDSFVLGWEKATPPLLRLAAKSKSEVT